MSWVLAAVLVRWKEPYGKLADWVEEQIGETFTSSRLPRQQCRHMRSTKKLERFSGELWRTRVVSANLSAG